MKFPIGAIIECFRLPTDDAVRRAASLGVQGIQMFCTEGEHAPENFGSAERRRLLSLVKSEGLEFSAICGDLGRGFGNKEQNPELIARSKKIMEIAADLETKIVTTHIGVVPSDPNHERYQIMQEACFELAEFADKLGFHFAVETGPEPAKDLKRFLDSLNSKGVAVNLDPANLAMVAADDPVAAVYTLKDYIVHTHAKDGLNLRKCNPEFVYRVLHPAPTEDGPNFREVPLGQGHVPFERYLAALWDVGYRGYLTIEREVGADPAADITMAVDFLKNHFTEK